MENPLKNFLQKIGKCTNWAPRPLKGINEENFFRKISSKIGKAHYREPRPIDGRSTPLGE